MIEGYQFFVNVHSQTKEPHKNNHVALVNFTQTTNITGWWFQPIWKNISQIGNHPQVGMEIKNIWNHHLDSYPTLHLCIHGGFEASYHRTITVAKKPRQHRSFGGSHRELRWATCDVTATFKSLKFDVPISYWWVHRDPKIMAYNSYPIYNMGSILPYMCRNMYQGFGTHCEKELFWIDIVVAGNRLHC